MLFPYTNPLKGRSQWKKESVSHSVVSNSWTTPWTVARQALPSLGFSRQEYWSGLPFPPPGDLPDPGIEPGSPALQADSLPSVLEYISSIHLCTIFKKRNASSSGGGEHHSSAVSASGRHCAWPLWGQAATSALPQAVHWARPYLARFQLSL